MAKLFHFEYYFEKKSHTFNFAQRKPLEKVRVNYNINSIDRHLAPPLNPLIQWNHVYVISFT